MAQFIGFVTLGDTLPATVLLRDSAETPKDSTGNPLYRIYGSSGLMSGGTGTLSTYRDSGSITGASNASPIVITDADHGVSTGQRVTVANVGGNTAANGDWQVTRLSTSTFSLDGSVGNGAYTSGGTWHASGLYALSHSILGGDGFASGGTYTIIVTATVSGTVKAQELTFVVV